MSTPTSGRRAPEARAISACTCFPSGATRRATPSASGPLSRWCEEVTLIGETHASDDAYAELTRMFSEDELVALTYVIVSINGFNRLAVAFRQPVAEPPAAHLKAS